MEQNLLKIKYSQQNIKYSQQINLMVLGDLLTSSSSTTIRILPWVSLKWYFIHYWTGFYDTYVHMHSIHICIMFDCSPLICRRATINSKCPLEQT